MHRISETQNLPESHLGRISNSSIDLIGTMDFQDIYTSVLLGTILLVFKIYSAIATVILLIGFPLTKYFVHKRLQSFGLKVGDKNPWDIRVHDQRTFYIRAALEGHFGVLESRLDNIWSTQDFREIVSRVLASRRIFEIQHPLLWTLKYFNLQTKARAWEVGNSHYDAGDAAIKAMIDKNLQYTCGYWRNAQDLDSAQIDKMDLIARKLQLKPGMRVLDIGCGYGTLAYYLAKNYKVEVVGNSISREQIACAQKLTQGLPCKFLLCDYRDITETFDRVVSVGMFEHVGRSNHREFFEVCNRCLKDDGILLLHSIGISHKTIPGYDQFTHKYIFPNGYIPYYMDICRAIEASWIIEDWHNFGFDYYKTLVAWEKNFDEKWPSLKDSHGQKFHIMWKMYLHIAQAAFFTRSFQLWQIVLSKDGLKGGYKSVR